MFIIWRVVFFSGTYRPAHIQMCSWIMAIALQKTLHSMRIIAAAISNNGYYSFSALEKYVLYVCNAHSAHILTFERNSHNVYRTHTFWRDDWIIHTLHIYTYPILHANRCRLKCQRERAIDWKDVITVQWRPSHICTISMLWYYHQMIWLLWWVQSDKRLLHSFLFCMVHDDERGHKREKATNSNGLTYVKIDIASTQPYFYGDIWRSMHFNVNARWFNVCATAFLLELSWYFECI